MSSSGSGRLSPGGRRSGGGFAPGAAAIALIVTTLGAAPPAHGQVIQGEQDRYRSPQHFAVELRFGPYTPDVDSEFDGRITPYKTFFGSSNRLMSQIEFDYQFLRHVGSAGIGLGVGYFSATGNNRAAAGGDITADKSTLKVIPFSLSAVYRFDLPYEQWRFPLIPYGKLGLDYAIWSINNGNGDVPHDPAGGQGQGGTWGWHAAIGLSLVLNMFDPVSARQFDVETGVNRTHLFVELGHWDISGLGSGNKLHVGDTTWLTGLLFEF